jgi:hypothetical protein
MQLKPAKYHGMLSAAPQTSTACLKTLSKNRIIFIDAIDEKGSGDSAS